MNSRVFVYMYLHMQKKMVRFDLERKKMTAKSLTALMDGFLFSLIPPFGRRDMECIDNTLEIFFQGLSK